jgi:CheY-like chemotaxis protein
VTLLLPAAATSAAPRTDMTMPLSTLRGGTEKVLVLAVDDDVRTTIRQILEVLGYAVRFAAGAPDALDALRADEFQLLVIDGPERDDERFLADVRALRPGAKLLATAEPNASPERRSAPSAGRQLLAKPFTIAELAAAVRRSLDA